MADTLIGKHTVLKGRISSTASVLVEGEIVGDIECLGNTKIAGSVRGNVRTKGTLTIVADGKLIGDASTGEIVIARRAVFQGNLELKGEVQDRSPDQQR